MANRITVLRNGGLVGTATPADASDASLASMMVGRPVLLRVEKAPARPGPPVCRVTGLGVLDDRGAPAVDEMDLVVYAGEIVGLAGVEGNGQTELVEALTGLRRIAAGRVVVLERDLTNRSPREIARAGASHVPEDRRKHALVLAQPLADNLVLSSYRERPFARGLRIVFEAIRRFARELVRDYDIRSRPVEAPAATLSGGNQQKAVVAREFSTPLELLVAAQPTRGVDIGSTEFIHRKIVEARDAGAGGLLVSAELDEVLGLADRARLGLLMGGDTARAESSAPE